MYALSQWEMALQCNAISHWLGAYRKWSLINAAVLLCCRKGNLRGKLPDVWVVVCEMHGTKYIYILDICMMLKCELTPINYVHNSVLAAGQNEIHKEIWLGSDEDRTYKTPHRMIVITMHSFWPTIIPISIAHLSVPDKIYWMVKTIHSGPFIIVCTDSLAENVNSLVPNEMIKILKFCMFSVTFFFR